MSDMEQFLRRSGLFIASALFAIMLLSTAGAAVTHFIFGDPNTIKSTVKKSGAYDHIVNAALDTAQQKAKEGKDETSVPLQDPAIRSIATNALTPQILQTNTEAFLDGT